MFKVFLYDEFTPEDNAMLQALYSRSPKSVQEHVEKVRAVGSGNFMSTYYVGYGHSSIADCGSTTLFIEGLSILADKAIQDWPLYSGQETSTRYVDMAKQPIIDPVNTSESKSILDSWMNFYIEAGEPLRDYLKTIYFKKPDENENIYEKAIKARSFDILRSFLPAGITTQLSWHTNLRQAWDKISLLRYWPLPEVRQIGEEMLSQLKTKYEHSFSHKPMPEQEEYRQELMNKYAYFNPEQAPEFSCELNFDKLKFAKYKDIIAKRPAKTCLPLFLGELGNICFDFHLDYGSFRDIQRHRNGQCRIPLLTAKLGFHQWYLDQLPEDLKTKAMSLIEQQKQAVDKLDASPEIKQYYHALGFKVPCRVAYGLPAIAYVIELRSGKPVHPTLRIIAHKMHNALISELPGLKLHSDLDPSDWDIKRGTEDIIEKT
ncbi:MAG: FAD-dependent thymidylate synthase [bacterium]